MEDDHAEKVSKIAGSLHKNIQEQLSLLQQNKPEDFNRPLLLSSLNQFQPAPQLLEDKLNEYVNILISSYLSNNFDDQSKSHTTSEIFYTIGKIVGYKKISTFMKTEIHLIPRILSRAQSEGLHWHEQYLLLCWLIVLVLTPFKLDSLQKTVKTGLYTIGMNQLNRIGPLQPLGSRLLGSLIMRADCRDQLSHFLGTFDDYQSFDEDLKIGYLQALNIALKRDVEDILEPYVMKLTAFCKSISGNENSKGNIEIIAKVTSKLGRYLNEMEEFDQIEDIVCFFLDNFNNKNTETRFILARKYAKLLLSIESCMCTEATLDLLTQTGEMISSSSADDCPFDTVNSDLLHTNLLTIAELLRTKAAPPYTYEEITGIIAKTLFFQQNRVTHIGGSNIRDASNFIAWSMAKYSPQKLNPEVLLANFQNLVCLSCFDKDIMIRRGAAAALQELMGRHGSHAWVTLYSEAPELNQVRNLCIANVLDYVDLGSLQKSYMEMPLRLIKGFPELEKVFERLLSSRCYNLDHEVAKMSGLALAKLISNNREKETLIQEQISHHIEMSKANSFGAFLVLSQLLKLTTKHDNLPLIVPIFETIIIDHHKTPPFQIVSYLSLLSSLLKLSYIPSDLVMSNLFSSMRIDSTEVKALIMDIAPFLTRVEEDTHWNEWLRYIKLGNQSASFAIALLSHFTADPKCTDDVLSLLTNEKVNHLVKTGILKSVSIFFQKGGELGNRKYIETICQCLDDYTITEQGDVGSNVRSGGILLLRENWKKLVSFKELFEVKLLRLSAEPMETIRFDAFDLIKRINGVEHIKIQREDKPFYFAQLLHIFSTYYLKEGTEASEILKEFWKGYALTCGASKSTDELITNSLNSFLQFYQNTTHQCQTRIILDVLANLKIEPIQAKGIKSSNAQRQAKLIQTSSQFLSVIFHSNLKLPQGFNIKGLYARVYNLHLNTTNLIKIKSAIEIFGYLAIVEVFEDSLDRLKYLTMNHPMAKIRVLAAEELFMVYSELSLRCDGDRYEANIKVLKSVDWSQNVKGLEAYTGKI